MLRVGFYWVSLASVLLALTGVSVVQAQPLVTDGLAVYYSFDSVDEDGFWADGSGNDLHGFTVVGEFNDANDDGLIDIRLDTDDKVRGDGSVLFDTDSATSEDFVAVCDPINGWYPEGCDVAEDKNLIPTNGLTVAAWVKVEPTGTDHAIWQSRATGGGFIHTQVQGNGNVRMQLRGDANTDNIVAYNEPPGGEPVPFEEWFHWVGTYQKTEPEEPGEWAFYFNGEEVAGGAANGEVAGNPDLDQLGDWGQGAFIGMVPDFARQFVGRMDEFYLFTRGLTAEEVQTLYQMEDVGLTGDFNSDGTLNAPDVDDLTGQVATATNPAPYDLNADALVNEADIGVWVKDLFNSWIGDANLDGEFNSSDLVSVLATGTYEADVASVWSTGDFNGDGRTNSGDLVAALADGGYEAGPRPAAAVAAVPEPSTTLLLLLGALTLGLRSRVRRAG
jgi:hypothetical protein